MISKNGLLTTIAVGAWMGADHVAFAVDPQFIRVTLNGVVTKLDADRVRSIQINTNGGNDEIILGRKLTIGALVYAGSGNDTVSGGAGDDTIFGGAGNDYLSGRQGNDYLDGNAGDDRLEDYLGRNTFHGGAGNDSALEDSGLLGSGVESRQMALDRDGVVTQYDIYDITEGGVGSGTYLFQDHGRLILEYMGGTGSGANQIKFSDLTRRDDGQYQVQVVTTTPGYGNAGTADMKYYTHQWDVTDAVKSGLVFMSKKIVPGSESAGVATTQAHQSSLLLAPSALSDNV